MSRDYERGDPQGFQGGPGDLTPRVGGEVPQGWTPLSNDLVEWALTPELNPTFSGCSCILTPRVGPLSGYPGQAPVKANCISVGQGQISASKGTDCVGLWGPDWNSFRTRSDFKADQAGQSPQGWTPVNTGLGPLTPVLGPLAGSIQSSVVGVDVGVCGKGPDLVQFGKKTGQVRPAMKVPSVAFCGRGPTQTHHDCSVRCCPVSGTHRTTHPQASSSNVPQLCLCMMCPMDTASSVTQVPFGHSRCQIWSSVQLGYRMYRDWCVCVCVCVCVCWKSTSWQYSSR